MRKAVTLLGKVIVLMVIALGLAITIIPRFLDHIYYSGPARSNFDGALFFNPDGDDTAGLPTGGSRGAFLASRIFGTDGSVAWPENVAITPAKPAQRVVGNRMTATWVGHATMLVQTQGLNILTDPVWSDRSGPFGIGPARVTAPGIAIDDLPKIDILVVSHNHYDHMDLDSIKQIWGRDQPTIVTSLGNEALIGQTGAKVTALDWGQRKTVRPGIDVIVTRNHHWSSRWFADRNRALWSSFVVTLPGGNLYFAGDTGFGDGRWAAETAAYGPVRLALIPIGAFRFRPGQMHIASHIGPIQAERIFASLNASFAIPIHWGTFKLSDEARDTPPRMLAEVMKCARYNNQNQFQAVEVGAVVDVPAYRQPAPRPAPSPACLQGPVIQSLR